MVSSSSMSQLIRSNSNLKLLLNFITILKSSNALSIAIPRHLWTTFLKLWKSRTLLFLRSTLLWRLTREIWSWRSSGLVLQECWFLLICWPEVLISNRSIWLSTMICLRAKRSIFIESVEVEDSEDREQLSTLLCLRMLSSWKKSKLFITLRSKKCLSMLLIYYHD